MPFVDALKAIACVLIVLHHLAFYGPMSDVAYPLLPTLIDWLYQYGRIAVQVFFVIAGFLLAGKLAPRGTSVITDPLRDIQRRYVRLAIPYLAALTLSVACAAIARAWMVHDATPNEPEFVQLLAHVFLLQGLLGEESLSAGVWYVAIDFQLFALSVIVLRLSTYVEFRFPKLTWTGPAMIAVLVVASLFGFNRDEWWSETALYFFGSYGLGALSYWASTTRRGAMWLGLLGLLVISALLVDFRSRIAVAGLVMLALGMGRTYGFMGRLPIPTFVTNLGRISYSVFLVHFPVCLIMNLVFATLFPHQAWINALGMLLALGVSVLVGTVFFKWIENRPLTNKMRFMVPAGFAASALLVTLSAR